MNDTEKLSDGAYRLHRFDDVPVRYDELQPWALDLVPERKEIADSLTALFRGSEHPFVVAVNAGWGTGKSLFLRMWSDDLINRGYACLTFNAWEYDHTDQPLTAFLTALRRQKEDRWSREPTFTTRMANRIADVCGNFFNTLPNIFPKIIGSGTTMGLAASGVPPTQAKAAGDVTESVAKQLLESSVEDAENRDTFKTQLQQFAKDLCAEEMLQGPLIVMVDELDRCRPDFAIALLEDIKHLFSVPGVVFVLAVEKNQLANCINARYGMEIAGAKSYLNKFIDMTIELPAPSSDAFIDVLQQTYPLPDPEKWSLFFKVPNSSVQSFLSFCKEVLSLYAFSLRDLAQIFCRLSIIVSDKAINPLAAVSCLFILAEMQKNTTMEEALLLLKQIGFSGSLDPRSPNFQLLPALSKENWYIYILQTACYKALGKNFIPDGSNTIRAEAYRANDGFPHASNIFRVQIHTLDDWLRDGPVGEPWLQQLRQTVALAQKVTVD